MLHTSLAVSANVLSSVIAFYAVGSIIGKKRMDVKGKSKVVLAVTLLLTDPRFCIKIHPC